MRARDLPPDTWLELTPHANPRPNTIPDVFCRIVGNGCSVGHYRVQMDAKGKTLQGYTTADQLLNYQLYRRKPPWAKVTCR
jgi:hypothetical protein